VRVSISNKYDWIGYINLGYDFRSLNRLSDCTSLLIWGRWGSIVMVRNYAYKYSPFRWFLPPDGDVLWYWFRALEVRFSRRGAIQTYVYLYLSHVVTITLHRICLYPLGFNCVYPWESMLRLTLLMFTGSHGIPWILIVPTDYPRRDSIRNLCNGCGTLWTVC